MTLAALVVAALAAALHVYIFLLESLWWTTRARGVFGTSAEEAAATREMAFNQGFYNLFLAVVTVVGIASYGVGGAQGDAVGAALVLAGTGSMLAAALVLLVTSPDKARAAITQGTLPLVAVVLVAVGLLV